MKNVPGWEVGKWFDEPVYKTVPKDHWIGKLSLFLKYLPFYTVA